jgi:hypothetical protein
LLFSVRGSFSIYLTEWMVNEVTIIRTELGT